MRRVRSQMSGLLGAGLGACALAATPAVAQEGLRPSQERPELEEFAPEEPLEAPLTLPPIPAPPPDGAALSVGRRVFVRGFRIDFRKRPDSDFSLIWKEPSWICQPIMIWSILWQ